MKPKVSCRAPIGCLKTGLAEAAEGIFRYRSQRATSLWSMAHMAWRI
jgi:hypothetical protein